MVCLLFIGLAHVFPLIRHGSVSQECQSSSSERRQLESSSAVVPCDSNPNHKACTKDSQHVYGDVGALLSGADPNTFVVLGGKGFYARDTSRVYWMVEAEEGPGPHQIPGADAQSFAVIPVIETYAKDKNHVYWEGEIFAPVPDVDPASFVSYRDGEECGPSCTYFARDKNHLYQSVAGHTVVQ